MIAKHFDSLKQAERFQDQLYAKYDHVRLTRSPLFTEQGWYVWEVR